MSLLTNGEIYTAYIEAANQTLRPQDERIALAFARAIIAATIDKLAAGVSVEPVAWMTSYGNVCRDDNKKSSMPFDDKEDYVVPLYTQEAIAAARVQALEEAAKICDVTPVQPFRPSIEAAWAIRALIGGSK